MASTFKIGTFGDWVGLFEEWRKEIGVNNSDVNAFKFETLYGQIETEEIQFGHYKGQRKWENLRRVPTQNMRDALLNLIVYQGDTEFASCEQQRFLFESAQAFRVGGEICQNFNRDISPQLRVARTVDLAHTSGTQQGEDFVGPESRSERQGHGPARL